MTQCHRCCNAHAGRFTAGPALAHGMMLHGGGALAPCMRAHTSLGPGRIGHFATKRSYYQAISMIRPYWIFELLPGATMLSPFKPVPGGC